MLLVLKLTLVIVGDTVSLILAVRVLRISLATFPLLVAKAPTLPLPSTSLTSNSILFPSGTSVRSKVPD